MFGRLKTRLCEFARDESGVAAVEMGLIAPIAFGSMLLAANTAYVLFQHQKVSSAAQAGANYLQDQSNRGEMSTLQKTTDPQTDDLVDGPAIMTTKLIIKDAHGSAIDLEDIDVTAYCGCPKPKPDTTHGFDDTQAFYTLSSAADDSSANICPTDCSDSTPSRVITKIVITHKMEDFFGHQEVVREEVMTRLR